LGRGLAPRPVAMHTMDKPKTQKQTVLDLLYERKDQGVRYEDFPYIQDNIRRVFSNLRDEGYDIPLVKIPGSKDVWVLREYTANIPAKYVVETRRKRKQKAEGTPKRSKHKRPDNARIGAMKKREVGDLALWWRTRRLTLQCIKNLMSLEPMILWRNVDAEDTLEVLDDLIELRQWADMAITGVQSRVDVSKIDEKIAVLENPNGRTGPEREAALAAANKLRQQRSRLLDAAA
jgi:hypothetical protein